MTKREQEILNLISDNPLISQDEIADKLNIARSSVSVYISNMQKKGIIVGRGYILDNQQEIAYPVCVGTVAIDFYGKIHDDAKNKVLYENADLAMSYGGCAKNVAEYLALLNYKPKILSAVGNDVLGRALLEECSKHELDISGCVSITGKNTSTYLDIKNTDSSTLYMGLTNWQINQELTADFFASKHRILDKANFIITDDSIPLESIKYLSYTHGRKKMILQSTARFPLLKDVLNLFEVVITDIAYLADLFAIPFNDEDYGIDLAKEVAALLNGINVRKCLFTFGPGTLCYLIEDKLYFSKVQFNDGLQEADNYQRFGTVRSAIAACVIHCMNEEFSIESTLRYVAATRHHITLYGRISDKPLTINYIEQHLSSSEDNLMVFAINSQ